MSYHGVEVVDSLNKGGLPGDFLVKAIAEIMRRVGGYNERFPAGSSEKSSETTAGCGLAASSLAPDEDPSEAFLI